MDCKYHLRAVSAQNNGEQLTPNSKVMPEKIQRQNMPLALEALRLLARFFRE
jgi:hypothetical protein